MISTQDTAKAIGVTFTLQELLDKPIPEPEPILSPWLRAGELGMIHANAGVGKTLVAQTLAIIAASGTSAFLTKGAGVPVLYIDGEMSAKEFQNRSRIISESLEVDPIGLPLVSALVASCPIDELEDFPFLDEPEGRDWVVSFVRENGIRFVVIDNIRCLARVEDENSAAAFADFNSFLSQLAALSCAVLTVHHDNRHGSYSGSTALLTPLSICLHLRATSASQANNASFEVLTTKNRNGISCEFTQGFSAELTSRGWDIETEAVSGVMEQFRRRAERFEFINQTEAAVALGKTARTISRYNATLVASEVWDDDTWSELTTKGLKLRGKPDASGDSKEDADIY